MNDIMERRRRNLIPSTIESIRSMVTRVYYVSSVYVIFYTLMISLNSIPLLRLLGWISSRTHDSGVVDFDAYDKVPTAEEDISHDTAILELVSNNNDSSSSSSIQSTATI